MYSVDSSGQVFKWKHTEPVSPDSPPRAASPQSQQLTATSRTTSPAARTLSGLFSATPRSISSFIKSLQSPQKPSQKTPPSSPTLLSTPTASPVTVPSLLSTTPEQKAPSPLAQVNTVPPEDITTPSPDTSESETAPSPHEQTNH